MRPTRSARSAAFWKGYVFRGLKPVNWCFDCGSALAEAEVEYADRVDPAVDVAFPFADRPALAKAFGLDSVDDGAIVIWTTTPWTIPSNQALNLHPEIEYALVRVSPAPVSGPLLLIAKDRVEDCLKQWQLEGDVIATAPGAALSGIRFRHPLAKANPGYDRTAPVYLGDYVTADSGTGVVHSAPTYGIEDFVSCKAHGMKDTDFISPVMGDGKYADSPPLFGGPSIWDANPKIVEALKLAGTLMHVESTSTATCTAGATRRPSSTAPPASGSRAWMSPPRTAARRCANRRWPASTPRPSIRPGAAPACTP